MDDSPIVKNEGRDKEALAYAEVEVFGIAKNGEILYSAKDEQKLSTCRIKIPAFNAGWESHDSVVGSKLREELKNLRLQNEDMNKNCISLFLHEQRMRSVEAELDCLRKSYDQLKKEVTINSVENKMPNGEYNE